MGDIPSTFMDPTTALRAGGIAARQRIAEFGAGFGNATMAAARLTGPQGKVYAIDVQKDLLQRIKNAALSQRLDNIEVVWGDVERIGGTKLKDDSVDAVLITNALFQFEEKDMALKEAWRILKSKGIVVIIDWVDSFGGMGPQPNDVVPRDAARALCEAAGFTYTKEFDAGSHHYGIICQKPE